MLALIRAAAVIGVIAYLSPERDAAPRETRPPPRALDLDQVDRLWEQLPVEARKAVIDNVLRAADQVGASQPGADAVVGRASRDTLRPEDRSPSWHGMRPR